MLKYASAHPTRDAAKRAGWNALALAGMLFDKESRRIYRTANSLLGYPHSLRGAALKELADHGIHALRAANLLLLSKKGMKRSLGATLIEELMKQHTDDYALRVKCSRAIERASDIELEPFLMERFSKLVGRDLRLARSPALSRMRRACNRILARLAVRRSQAEELVFCAQALAHTGAEGARELVIRHGPDILLPAKFLLYSSDAAERHFGALLLKELRTLALTAKALGREERYWDGVKESSWRALASAASAEEFAELKRKIENAMHIDREDMVAYKGVFDVRDNLRTLADREKSESERIKAADSLFKFNFESTALAEEALASLLSFLADKGGNGMKKEATRILLGNGSLRRTCTPDIAERLAGAEERGDKGLRTATLYLLGRFEGYADDAYERAFDILTKYLRHPDPELQREAVESILSPSFARKEWRESILYELHLTLIWLKERKSELNGENGFVMIGEGGVARKDPRELCQFYDELTKLILSSSYGEALRELSGRNGTSLNIELPSPTHER